MMKKFKIEPYHFEYLVIQRGRISDLAGDFKKWKEAYDKLIEYDFQTMKPVLPVYAERMLDVGGGLSGISARLKEHYGRLHCIVLDGKNDPPVVSARNRTFNNAAFTQSFLRANGVESQQFVTPDDLVPPGLDLVVSIQAWGFHFGPDLYAPQVREALRENGVLIVDVRVEQPLWFEEFHTTFGPCARLVASAPKWNRWAFSKDPI